MKRNLQVAKEILKKYNQEHLLCFYDELNEEQKECLINQICSKDYVSRILDFAMKFLQAEAFHRAASVCLPGHRSRCSWSYKQG